MKLKFEQYSHRRLILVLLAVSFVFLMFGNDYLSLTHPDEVFYTQTAKEMRQRGSWLTPFLFDAPQFEKPILFYWLLAGAQQIFGDSPFAARFWPAFFGMVGVILTYWISWMLFAKKRLAFMAGVILSTNVIYFILSRAVLIDMVFSVWIVLAVALFYGGFQNQKYSDVSLVLCWVVTALAVLSKGLLGICFPWVVIAGYLVYKKNFFYLFRESFAWGLVIFLVLVVPWHLLMYERYGAAFADEYFRNVHWRRLFEAEHPRCNTWFFYPGTIFAGMVPWAFYLFPAAGWVYQQFKINKQVRGPFIFLFIWFLGVFIFLQPAKSKLASYILPAFPVVCIFLAHYFEGLLEQKRQRQSRGFVIASVLFVFVFFAASIAAHFAAARYPDVVMSTFPLKVLTGLVTVWALAMLVFLTKRRWAGVLMVMATVLLMVNVMVVFAKDQLEPWVTCRVVSEELKRIDQSDTTVLTSKFYVRGIRYFTDRKVATFDMAGKRFFSEHPIPFLNNDEVAVNFLNSQPVTYAVMKEGDLVDIERIARDGGYRITNLGGEGGKYIIRVQK